jgi:hypothetical protein
MQTLTAVEETTTLMNEAKDWSVWRGSWKRFDEAERLLSADMACAGARKAIEAGELQEKAIRRTEAAGRNHARG